MAAGVVLVDAHRIDEIVPPGTGLVPSEKPDALTDPALRRRPASR